SEAQEDKWPDLEEEGSESTEDELDALVDEVPEDALPELEEVGEPADDNLDELLDESAEDTLPELEEE
ncbi:hypothetical protein, partial [Pseudoalteromonas piscicida]